MSRTTFDQLLQAGCHFGHLKRKWNPAMAPYIFMERNGIHILDLHKTVVKIDEAAEALKGIAKQGKKILFVATKKQAKDIVAEKAASVNMPYIIERWAGGTLTNFQTIRKAVKKMTNIDKMMNDGTFSNLSKRELCRSSASVLSSRRTSVLSPTLTVCLLLCSSLTLPRSTSPLRRLTAWVSRYSVSLIPTLTHATSTTLSRLTTTPRTLSR